MSRSAAELIAAAQAATTVEELEALQSEVEGRVTVQDAIEQRLDELEAEESAMPDAPVVDASPSGPPILLNTQTLEDVLAAYPAPASDAETLALEPNDYESATDGPDAQISPTMYVHMTRPDGSEFLAPLSNVEHYEAKGFTAGAEEDIPDLVAYQAERAATEPTTS